MAGDINQALKAYKDTLSKAQGDSEPDAQSDGDWLAAFAANDAEMDKINLSRTAKAAKSGIGAAGGAASPEKAGAGKNGMPPPQDETKKRFEPYLSKITFPKTSFKKTAGEGGESGGEVGDETAGDSKVRRVAKFLILIGSEAAAKVMENLDEEQIEEISREIAAIRGISSEEAALIFGEFQALLAGNYSYGGVPQGGVNEARKLLYRAFGPEKGEAMLRKALPGEEEKIFSFLENFSGEQISLLLKDEHPAAAALILSRIDPKISAEVIAAQDDARRKEIVRRIARLERVSPEVLMKVAEGLRKRAHNLGNINTTSFNGTETLAAILKSMDISFGDKILDELSSTDADLSQNIKEKLFTLDDVIKAENRPIQQKLQSMNTRDIAILIKGRPDGFADKILSNLSSHRRSEVKAEIDFMGPVLKKDCEDAMKAFMDWFRDAREDGLILLSGDELVD